VQRLRLQESDGGAIVSPPVGISLDARQVAAALENLRAPLFRHINDGPEPVRFSPESKHCITSPKESTFQRGILSSL
jgi:hypothetical protein